MPLHPVIAAMVEQATQATVATAGSPSLVDLRGQFESQAALLCPGSVLERVTDIELPGRRGAVAARLYEPGGPPSIVVVYVHGGGWVVGSLDSFDAFARELSARSGAVVVSVDYALAPEHPFPAGADDVADAVTAVVQGLDSLPPDAAIVLVGDSAGANLVIAAVLDRADPAAIARVALLYPVTDADFSRPSYREHGTGLLLTESGMRAFFDAYAPGQTRRNPRVTPLHAESLRHFPPTLVVTAEYDALRDEGEEFARRLRTDGVDAHLRRYDGVTHGFVRLSGSVDVADAALDDLAAFVATGRLPRDATSATPQASEGHRGGILYLVSQEPKPGYEDVFRRWYDDEHIPELLRCPGFESATRYELVAGMSDAPRYVAIYEVSDMDAFTSAEYLQQSQRRPEEMTPTAREALANRVLHFTGKYRAVGNPT